MLNQVRFAGSYVSRLLLQLWSLHVKTQFSKLWQFGEFATNLVVVRDKIPVYQQRSLCEESNCAAVLPPSWSLVESITLSFTLSAFHIRSRDAFIHLCYRSELIDKLCNNFIIDERQSNKFKHFYKARKLLSNWLNQSKNEHRWTVDGLFRVLVFWI